MNTLIKYLWGLLTEVMSLVMIIVLYPFKPSKLDAPREGKPDILCVHGYLHNGSPWGYFRRKLHAAGFGAVNSLTYHSLTQDIPTNSLTIKAKIEEIKAQTGKDVQIIIGHSQGGLVALEYALEYAPKNIPIYIITMGSPLHGSHLACIALGPSGCQMKIDSEYIKSLHERLAKASHIRLLALYSDVDLMVWPTSSACIAEYPFAQNEKIASIGHIAFLFSKRVLNKIIAYLKQAQVR